MTLRSAYVTPRGLVVNQDRGLVTQAIGAMVLPLYSGHGILDVAVIIGAWSSVHTDQGDAKVGPWNEFDFFANLKLTFLKKLDVGAAYVVFVSPPGNFQSEHNLEFTLSFDDSSYLHGFGLHPYAKFFWAVAGDSTVVLGQKGGTMDVELGLGPSYTVKLGKSPRYPLALSAPIWLTVGPESFWGTTQNLGVFVAGLNFSLGLGFIPRRFGSWHLVGGIQDYYLINDNLVAAATALGNSDSRNRVMGYGGFGFNY